MRHLLSAISIIVLLASISSCKWRQSTTNSTANVSKTDVGLPDDRNMAVQTYMPPEPPAVLTEEEQIIDFYRYHFWDNLKLSPDITAVDTAMMLNAFMSYVILLENTDRLDARPVEDLMGHCIGDRQKLDLFSMLAENILNDPNSPYREDELYMPVLRARIASGLYDHATQVREQHKLDIAMQNRTGHKANDFRYTLKDGSTGSLYQLEAEYTLVFINNPGCNMCRTVREELMASDFLMQLVADGTMRILGIYPDENLDDWNEYYDEIPSDWINGYDKGCNIRRTGSYKLDAIPALYLLDADKNVLLKDGTDAGTVAGIIAHERARAIYD